MAIFCVVCAHCPYDEKNVLSCILNNLGVIGVPIFFIFSGFYYRIEKYSLKTLFFKKIKSIIVPWFFCGILVYLYIAIRKGFGGIFSIFEFILGYGSYLYYLTVLIVFYSFFYLIKNNTKITSCLCVISFLWIILQSVFTSIVYFIYPYLNPLNWLIYFSIGILSQKFNLEKIVMFFKRYRVSFFFLSAISFIIPLCISYKFTYWSIWYFIFEVICFCGMVSFSLIPEMQKPFLLDIGRKSFSIYMLHMPIVGITNLFLVHYLVYCIRPFFVVLILYLCIILYSVIVRKLKCDILYDLIGVRKQYNKEQK